MSAVQDGTRKDQRMSEDVSAELKPLPPIVLDLTPWDVFRALEALRDGGWLIAGWVADALEAAAPEHMARLADVHSTVRATPPITAEIP